MKQLLFFLSLLLIVATVLARTGNDCGRTYPEREERWLDAMMMIGVFAIFGAMTNMVVKLGEAKVGEAKSE